MLAFGALVFWPLNSSLPEEKKTVAEASVVEASTTAGTEAGAPKFPEDILSPKTKEEENEGIDTRHLIETIERRRADKQSVYDLIIYAIFTKNTKPLKWFAENYPQAVKDFKDSQYYYNFKLAGNPVIKEAFGILGVDEKLFEGQV